MEINPMPSRYVYFINNNIKGKGKKGSVNEWNPEKYQKPEISRASSKICRKK
jgi:hypothetical protein